jgi:D-alanyl-D-alanine carboxypeptidase (penicillin-binding protein 5/6)
MEHIMKRLFIISWLIIFDVTLAQAAEDSLNLNAQQAFLIDLNTHMVLYEKEADTLSAPSSMSKIMTIYMVFEALKMGLVKSDTLVTVSEKAWRTEGSRMFIKVGMKVPVQDLLRGVIVQSGNDAAVALAEWIAGTEADFADLMNKKAREMGVTKSNLVNATGLPNENHQMTPRELALIAERTIKDFPDLYPLYAEKTFQFNNISQPNRNPLLGSFEGCDGLKTGHTDAGGYGLVASAVRDGRRLIMVINGCKSANARSADADRLMNWGFTYFVSPRILAANKVVDEADVWLGEKGHVKLMSDRDIFTLVPRKDLRDIKIEVSYKGPIAAPIKRGQKVANVVITIPGKDPINHHLVAAEDVERVGFLSRIRMAFNYLVYGNSS